MISIQIADHRFQLRAAAVVVHAGHVLLHRLEGDTFWALPGGRVEPGEDASATVVREMAEELDEHVACSDLLYVVENFFTHAGQKNHEIGFYFRVELAPKSTRLNLTQDHAGIEGSKRLQFRWFPTATLETVELRPAFLRQSLTQPLHGVRHFIQRD